MKSLCAITFCVMLAVGVLGLSGQAQAANFSITNPDQYFWIDAGNETTFKLTNYESAFSNAWSSDASTWTSTGSIGVGSYLRGIFKVTSSQNAGATDSRFASGFELTGEFSGKVSKVTPTSATTALFELVPDAAFETAYGAGAMVQFFNDSTEDFTGLGTLSASHASATGGTKYMTIGAPSSPVWGTNYYWNASGSVIPGVAAFAASLDLLTNNTGINSSDFKPLTQAPAAPGAASLGLIANLFGLQGNTVLTPTPPIGQSYPWQLKSEDPLRAIVIPLPGAVWAGLGMLGMLGAARMRRRRRS